MKRIAEDLLGLKERPKTINSKKKGNRSESVLADLLTKWTGVKFARVPSSGGLRWVNAKNLIGDVTPSDLDFDFPFVVETKFYKHIEFKEYMRENSKVFTFWQQVLDDSKRANKLPILFVRINGMPAKTFKVFVTYDIANQLTLLGIELKHFAYNGEYRLVGFDSTDLVAIPYEKVHNLS